MQFLKGIYHFLLAWLGSVVYRYPSRELFALGVTGTKGKSTTLELINVILEAAGKTTALLSSVRVKVGPESEKNQTDTTMPGRFFIQRFLRQAVNAGCEIALVEVTSQGVSQHRHRNIAWDAAVFLNLHPEHIEAHGSFEAYRAAKVQFFRDAARSPKANKFFFVNSADPAADFFTRAATAGKVVPWSAEKFLKVELGANPHALGPWFEAQFNLEDAAAASAVAREIGVPWDTAKAALANFRGVPGRFEWVQAEPFGVVVDYAHTPDSLEAIYRTLKEYLVKRQAKGTAETASLNDKLICVLGSCGGGRDKWKRKEFGKIAAKYCGRIILTNEDPYDENPEKILEQIADGISRDANVHGEEHCMKILDRREAIKKAISLAKPGDIVVTTGKGSESWMHLRKGAKIPWNERQAVEEAIRGIRSAN